MRVALLAVLAALLFAPRTADAQPDDPTIGMEFEFAGAGNRIVLFEDIGRLAGGDPLGIGLQVQRPLEHMLRSSRALAAPRAPAASADGHLVVGF